MAHKKYRLSANGQEMWTYIQAMEWIVEGHDDVNELNFESYISFKKYIDKLIDLLKTPGLTAEDCFDGN